jgi:hypothetical protein
MGPHVLFPNISWLLILPPLFAPVMARPSDNFRRYHCLETQTSRMSEGIQ